MCSTRSSGITSPRQAENELSEPERQLLRLESRWNIPEWKVAEFLKLTTATGFADWTQFDAFLTSKIKTRPGGAAELNAERIGPYGVDKDDWFWRCGPNNDPYPGLEDGIFPAARHTLPFEVQMRLVSVLNSRPGAVAAGLMQDVYEVEWPEWVSFSLWLADEFGAYFVEMEGQRLKRDRSRVVLDLVRESIKFGVLSDPSKPTPHRPPFKSPTKLLLKLQKQQEERMETESEEEEEDCEGEKGEEEYHCGPTPLSLEDKTFDDMCCPDCGSNNAVAKVFKCRMSRNAHQKGSLRIDPRVKAMISLCTMHHVSQVQTEPLVCGLAKLLGRSIEQFPKRFAQQQILREIGIGAKAELCAQLLLWLDECGPQTITSCIDAASIGEDKYEGIAFVRKYFSEPHNPRQPHVFKRIALGLIDLVEGTDINKHVKILELMQDCINCYNFVHEPPRPMTLLHMALLVGYTCNDHAESTVPNRFVPWIRDVLVSEVGTPAVIRKGTNI
jgi:hypothetical protein